MCDIFSLFFGLEDPRHASGRRYKLESLLSLIVVGLLCGRNNMASIWRLSQSFTTEQRLALGFDKWRLPSHPILTTLLQQLDARALEQHLCRIFYSQDDADHALLALDGKTLRGSRVGTHKAMHMLSVFSQSLSAVPHSMPVASGENEITTALRLLEHCELKGTIITGDAIFAQQNICRTIKNKGGDYMFALKDNHKPVRTAIEHALDTADKKTENYEDA